MTTSPPASVAQSLAAPKPITPASQLAMGSTAATEIADSMSHPELAELAALAARRGRLAALLTTIMMIGYFGFIGLVAFAKPTAGTLLAGERVSVGIVAGACVIVLAPILTSIYVRWANRHYDVAVRRLRGGKA